MTTGAPKEGPISIKVSENEQVAENGVVQEAVSESSDVNTQQPMTSSLNQLECQDDGKSTSDDGVDEDDDDDQSLEPSKTYELLIRQPVCRCCFKRFPRTCAVLIGVIIPIFALILVSVGFGAKLCDYESPGEIDSNDGILANIFIANRTSAIVTNLTKILPRLCFVLYLDNVNSSSLEEALDIALFGLIENSTTWLGVDVQTPKDTLLVPSLGANYGEQWENQTLSIDGDSFFEFMSECGEAADNTATQLLDRSLASLLESSINLTFNWIRCFPGAHSGSRSFAGGQLTSQERSQQGQSQWFTAVWLEDREELFKEYYFQLLQDGVNQTGAFKQAAIQSTEDASGGSGCDVNAPAAAWWWFTVMTTIGYGNQAPVTSQGRALVFTVGFVSILAFGGVMATAGNILSYLYDDFVIRNTAKILAKPWVACIILGVLYYAWMVVIAQVTITWKEARLNIDFPWNDAYWFAYISTTTVGLGDFFLEPEGITGDDIIYFPLIFLVGLVMLALFLGKFAEFLVQILRRGRKSFMDTLLEKRVRWRDTFARDIDVIETKGHVDRNDQQSNNKLNDETTSPS